MTVRRARYGALDNRHDLLPGEGRREEAPEALRGLTDRPHGNLSPGDVWGPAVGCGPVDAWWALWWTVPDEKATRGGMVRSEVALWPRAEVGSVPDLRPALDELSGGAQRGVVSEEFIGALADRLIASGPLPPVVIGHRVWPEILAAIWDRLWPEARREFSARLALQPPQRGDSIAPVTLFCTPASRGLQWSNHPSLTETATTAATTRAATYFMRRHDATMQEVIGAPDTLGGSIGVLQRVARAADALDSLRGDPSARAATSLLRALLTQDAPPPPAGVMKEAVDALLHGLDGEPFAFLLKLRNLDLDDTVKATDALGQALSRRVLSEAPRASAREMTGMLEAALASDALPWWRRAVEVSLRRGFDELDDAWADASLRWLSEGAGGDALQAMLLAKSGVEWRLLARAPRATLSRAAIEHLRQVSGRRRWSSLHAWAAKEMLAPAEAIRAQRAQTFENDTGLDLLIRDLPGADLVAFAVTEEGADLVERVSMRTAREPALLRPLDASDPAWLRLWNAHVRRGGEAWPLGLDRAGAARGVLDAVLRGQVVDAIVHGCASHLAPAALLHDERARLWPRLAREARESLLDATARELLQACEALPRPDVPEGYLAEAVRRVARSQRLSGRPLVTLMTWGYLSEEDALDHMRPLRSEDIAAQADEFGDAVAQRGWKRMAGKLYDRWIGFSGLHDAVSRCKSLLTWTERFRFECGDGGRFDERRFAERLAEIAAETMPKDLERIWRYAGGDPKSLELGGSSATMWFRAVEFARNGGLEGGVGALLDTLRHELPGNDDLRHLIALFERAHPRRAGRP